MAPDLDSLGSAEYVLLTTFRKDGTAVATPVWVGKNGTELVAWTVREAGKVTRIRRNPDVLVSACDVRGRPSGEAATGTARVLDADATEQVRAVLATKYGIRGRLVLAASKIRRGRSGTVGLAITLMHAEQERPAKGI